MKKIMKINHRSCLNAHEIDNFCFFVSILVIIFRLAGAIVRVLLYSTCEKKNILDSYLSKYSWFHLLQSYE